MARFRFGLLEKKISVRSGEFLADQATILAHLNEGFGLHFTVGAELQEGLTSSCFGVTSFSGSVKVCIRIKILHFLFNLEVYDDIDD